MSKGFIGIEIYGVFVNDAGDTVRGFGNAFRIDVEGSLSERRQFDEYSDYIITIGNMLRRNGWHCRFSLEISTFSRQGTRTGSTRLDMEGTPDGYIDAVDHESGER